MNFVAIFLAIFAPPVLVFTALLAVVTGAAVGAAAYGTSINDRWMKGLCAAWGGLVPLLVAVVAAWLFGG